MNLELNKNELNIVVAALGKLPMETVEEVVYSIRKQVEDFNKATKDEAETNKE